MLISMKEFLEKYCQDILKEHTAHRKIIDDDTFPYDAIDTINDEEMKIVYDDKGESIPVDDIIGLKEQAFIAVHPGESALAMYRQYLSAYTILNGAEVLERMRNEIALEKQRIANFSKYSCDDLV